MLLNSIDASEGHRGSKLVASNEHAIDAITNPQSEFGPILHSAFVNHVASASNIDVMQRNRIDAAFIFYDSSFRIHHSSFLSSGV